MTGPQISHFHQSRWDAIVVGAGPAGSTAAYLLAKSGLQTLHIDRRTFPRTKVCGGYLNGHSLKILDRIGMGGLIQSLPGEQVSSMHLQCGRGASLRVPLPPGLAIARSTLDSAMAKAAAGAGAVFLDGVTAEVAPVPSLDRRDVDLHCPDGSTCSLSGRVIVAADGLGHPSLRRVEEFRCRVSRGSRIGAGALIEDTSGQFPAGVIHMAVSRSGYVGLVAVDDGLLNLACAIDPAIVKHCGGLANAAERILVGAAFPVPAKLWEAAWQGTVPLSRRVARPVGRRVFLIGDAAGYVEPFTGEGMTWALAGGTTVPEFVHRGLADWTPRLEDAWIRAHNRVVVHRQWLCRTLAAVLRSPALFDSILRVCARFPSVAGAVVRRVNAVPEDWRWDKTLIGAKPL